MLAPHSHSQSSAPSASSLPLCVFTASSSLALFHTRTRHLSFQHTRHRAHTLCLYHRHSPLLRVATARSHAGSGRRRGDSRNRQCYESAVEAEQGDMVQIRMHGQQKSQDDEYEDRVMGDTGAMGGRTQRPYNTHSQGKESARSLPISGNTLQQIG